MFTSTLKKLTLLTLAVAFTVAAQLASSAHAMCIYNNTEVEIFVEFKCGWFCGNVWTTEPQNHYCRPSEGGEVNIPLKPSKVQNAYVDVDDHGWVEMNETGGEVEVCVYQPNEDPRARVCIYFEAADTLNLAASTEQQAPKIERSSWLQTKSQP